MTSSGYPCRAKGESPERTGDSVGPCVSEVWAQACALALDGGDTYLLGDHPEGKGRAGSSRHATCTFGIAGRPAGLSWGAADLPSGL